MQKLEMNELHKYVPWGWVTTVQKVGSLRVSAGLCTMLRVRRVSLVLRGLRYVVDV